MKKFSVLASALAIIASSVFVSCIDDKGLTNVVSAIVTVKDNGSGQAEFQVNDYTIVRPMNITGMPFGKKEVRALTQYQEVKKEVLDGGGAVIDAKVVYLDSVLTKPTLLTLGMEKDNITYGNDPIEVSKSWVTVAEDGYVTIQFLTQWGGRKPHRINLTHGFHDPYEFHLCHDANGDYRGNYGYGIVAFNIKDVIKEAGKNPTTIHIHYNSYSGTKAINLTYGTPASGKSAEAAVAAHLIEVE